MLKVFKASKIDCCNGPIGLEILAEYLNYRSYVSACKNNYYDYFLLARVLFKICLIVCQSKEKFVIFFEIVKVCF